MTKAVKYRKLYGMEVTAVIPDDLINTVRKYTQSPTVTEAITVALRDWVDIHAVRELNREILQNPVHINNGQQIRELNRSV